MSSQMPATPPARSRRRMIRRPIVSPITPPSRPPRAASPITPPIRAHPRRGQKFGAAKKKGMSIGGFAKLGLFKEDGREELKPLRGPPKVVRPGSRRLGPGLNAYNESDDELNRIFDSDEEDANAANSSPALAEASLDPNYNPDLSDSDMSYSPPPKDRQNFLGTLSFYSTTTTHPVNVASAEPATYFRHCSFTPDISSTHEDQSTSSIPIAYWKWPSAKRPPNHKINDSAQDASDRNMSFSSLLPSTSPMDNSDLRLLKKTQLPHVSWTQRAIDVIEHAKKELLATQSKDKEVEEQRRAHAEKMRLNKSETMKAVVAGVVIDDNDGFIRVKGTRKRQCAGIDLDADRPRRKYIWKGGRPPLRGKARSEHKARIAAERKAKSEGRHARRHAGLPVSETEEEGVPEPSTPETKHSTKRRSGSKHNSQVKPVVRKD